MVMTYVYHVWFLECTHIFRKAQLIAFGLQYAGLSWDELKHIRQAVGFLVSLLFDNMTPYHTIYLTDVVNDGLFFG